MHASIWRFAGDPDELLARYDAMLAELPREQMRLHLCLRDRDGIMIVNTCPTAEAFHAFAGSGWCASCAGTRARRSRRAERPPGSRRARRRCAGGGLSGQ